MLRNRQENEASKLQGVNLVADSIKIPLGYFTFLQNWIPTRKNKFKKKRGVATFASGFQPPLSFPPPVVNAAHNCGEASLPQITVTSADGSGNKINCHGSAQVTLHVTGGLAPYVWSTTGGLLSTLQGALTNLTPAANPGSGVAGAATVQSVWQCTSSTSCPVCLTINTFCGHRYKCNDQLDDTLVGTCSPPTPPQADATCHTQTGQPCLPQCQTGGVYDACVGIHTICDNRTQQMITDGCFPCSIQFIGGIIVTVTDTNGNTAFVTITVL